MFGWCVFCVKFQHRKIIGFWEVSSEVVEVVTDKMVELGKEIRAVL